jgi:hypothetical protein
MRWRAPSSRCWSIPWSVSSGRNTCTTASRSSAPAWKTTSAPSCSACRWACDVCYTNHAEADQDDMDVLLTMLGAAGCTFVMGVPGADDIMLNYQTTSFHDALYARRVLGLQPAPEFDAWLRDMGIFMAMRRPRWAARCRRHSSVRCCSCPEGGRHARRHPRGPIPGRPCASSRPPASRSGIPASASRPAPSSTSSWPMPCARRRARGARPEAWQALARPGRIALAAVLHSAAENRNVYLQRPGPWPRLDAPSRAPCVSPDCGGRARAIQNATWHRHRGRPVGVAVAQNAAPFLRALRHGWRWSHGAGAA